MKLRKILISSLVTILLATSIQAAEVQPKIYINNLELYQSEAIGKAYVVSSSNRTMVPVRLISETLGFKVDWNGAAKTATITNGKNTVVITLNKKLLRSMEIQFH